MNKLSDRKFLLLKMAAFVPDGKYTSIITMRALIKKTDEKTRKIMNSIPIWVWQQKLAESIGRQEGFFDRVYWKQLSKEDLLEIKKNSVDSEKWFYHNNRCVYRITQKGREEFKNQLKLRRKAKR